MQPISFPALLALPLLVSSPADAQEEDQQEDQQEERYHGDLSSVLDAAAPDELVPVVVVLADQVPSQELRSEVQALPRSARRDHVVGRLQDVARGSQADLLAWLEARVAAGEARSVRSLWIHNVVGVEIRPAAARELAARADVAYLHHDPPRGEEVLVKTAPVAGTPTCGVELIGAPDVWSSYGITGKKVVVGVIDTGLCRKHPDINAQLWTNPCEIKQNGIDDDQNGYVDDRRGWNFRDDNKDTKDDNSHGSHVSGTVAGDGTSGTQAGVAPDAEIMILKFWNSFAGEQSVWEAMQYGVDNGADVLTASLGWPHSFGPDRATWRAVCENAISAGAVVIYAAGNEGCSDPLDDVRTPGDVPDVITVGAVDCNDVKASFSSCGPVTWENVAPYNDHPYPPGLTKPDVSAEGASTVSHDLCSGYKTLAGTSMATPHVAGTAALLLEADPLLDHFGVKAILEGTAVDLGVSGKDNEFGSGRIDAFAAVTAALANGNHCEAKLNSCGTVPTIGSSGKSSASQSSGFEITATNMAAQQVALLVYSDQGPANQPALGGAICIDGPLRGVPVFDTTGTPGQCDGTVSIDMNAFASGSLGGNPHPFLSVPGTTVDCQFWGRDPQNSQGALLTGRLNYTVCP